MKETWPDFSHNELYCLLLRPFFSSRRRLWTGTRARLAPPLQDQAAAPPTATAVLVLVCEDSPNLLGRRRGASALSDPSDSWCHTTEMLTMNLPFLLLACPPPACLPALSSRERRPGSSFSCQSAPTTTNHYIPSDFCTDRQKTLETSVSRCVYMHASAQLQAKPRTRISPSLYLFIYLFIPFSAWRNHF